MNTVERLARIAIPGVWRLEPKQKAAIGRMRDVLIDLRDNPPESVSGIDVDLITGTTNEEYLSTAVFKESINAILEEADD